MTAVPGIYSCIIANLPYVDPEWERSPETNHEPKQALFADKNGVALIYQLLDQAILQLAANGLLILEADPYQHPRIIERATSLGFSHVETRGYGLAFIKK